MNVLHRSIVLLAAVSIGLSATNTVLAIVTSQSQVWDFEPDAWTRANDSNTSYFGWDDVSNAAAELAPTLPFPTGARVLDDATPDLGTAITASGMRLYQGTEAGRGLFAGHVRPPEHQWKLLLRVQRHGHRR